MSTRGSILQALSGADSYLSGQALAEKLGVSRAAVWKHVESLKREGYLIEGVRSRGYRLVGAPDLLTAESIGSLLTTERVGREMVVRVVTGSTNSDALELGRTGKPEGTVVIAEEQTAGRGRLGRTWESARGVNLYLSLLLRPDIVPAEAPQLSLVAGVAVALTVEEEGLDCSIKWPNDIVVGGKKLAGILTEIEAETDRVACVVVGIGINLNSNLTHFPDALHDIATTILVESGTTIDRAAFAARLLGHFERCYDLFLREGFAAVAPEWERRSVLKGREVTVSGSREEFSGTCVGIDTDGALLLEEGGPGGNGQVRRVLAGDVTVTGGYSS